MSYCIPPTVLRIVRLQRYGSLSLKHINNSPNSKNNVSEIGSIVFIFVCRVLSVAGPMPLGERKDGSSVKGSTKTNGTKNGHVQEATNIGYVGQRGQKGGCESKQRNRKVPGLWKSFKVSITLWGRAKGILKWIFCSKHCLGTVRQRSFPLNSISSRNVDEPTEQQS